MFDHQNFLYKILRNTGYISFFINVCNKFKLVFYDLWILSILLAHKNQYIGYEFPVTIGVRFS